MTNVGIVIVSHSPRVAEGAADMVRQMVGSSVPLAWTGGNADGGLGTDVAKIMAAIERVWSDAGVAILVDLGGAETNSEMAIGMVASAAAAARWLTRPRSPSPPATSSACAGASTSSSVFWPRSDLPSFLTASMARPRARAASAEVGSGGSCRPKVMNSTPYSGPEAPPTFITRVVPTSVIASGNGRSARASSWASTASKPRFRLSPWSPSPMA